MHDVWPCRKIKFGRFLWHAIQKLIKDFYQSYWLRTSIWGCPYFPLVKYLYFYDALLFYFFYKIPKFFKKITILCCWLLLMKIGFYIKLCRENFFGFHLGLAFVPPLFTALCVSILSYPKMDYRNGFEWEKQSDSFKEVYTQSSQSGM